MTAFLRRRWVRPAGFVLLLLTIEWLDEVFFGLREAAWPLVRNDLSLSYVQIGLILSIPGLFATVVEPFIGILGDTARRRILILGGGVFFAIACILTGISQSFGLLIVASMLFYPASGAFVSLSQAALMDYQPQRHEHNMARWTLAGSIGVVTGPLLLGLALGLNGTWRTMFIFFGLLAVILVFIARRYPFNPGTASSEDGDETPISFMQGLRNAWVALRRREVLRWLILLEFANLMMDILLGYLALYFVDVVHVTEGQAGLAVAVWTGIGLIGDILLIPLLERMRGLTYLRISAVIELVLFSAFLLVEPFALKLVVLGLLGFFNSGWYSILQGQLYTAMPGQSGTVITLGNITGLFNDLSPLVLGLLAEHFGLNVAMWFLLLGPIALLIGLPRAAPSSLASFPDTPE